MDRVAKLETENADLKKKLEDVLARYEMNDEIRNLLLLDYRKSKVN